MDLKYYVDTSIWRDYYENRVDKFRPLGEWAFQFLLCIKLERNIILYSDLVINELLKRYNNKEIKNIFKIISKHNLLKKVKINDFEIKESHELSKKLKIPFGDCLHAILARNNNAIIITRDKHFFELQQIVSFNTPEELI